MSERTYRCKRRILGEDRTEHQAGDLVRFGQSDAERLLSLGAIEVAEGPAASSPAPEAEPSAPDPNDEPEAAPTPETNEPDHTQEQHAPEAGSAPDAPDSGESTPAA